MAQSNETNAPSFIAWHVKDVGEEKSYWHRVGCAWEHADGNGLNIHLEAVPINGRLVLRKPKEEN